MFDLYFKKIKELLSTVEQNEKETITKAAEAIAECIQRDGLIYVFGCGHSHILAEELFYRAGGLAPIHPIFVEDLMLHKGAVRSSVLEKKSGHAATFMGKIKITPKDLLIVVSTSGINPVPIDVAAIARQNGAFVIGITSTGYAKLQPSRHNSGKYLADVADLVIDNHIEVGDALMQLRSVEVRFGPGSTVIGAAIVNGVMVEAVKIMAENQLEVPIFKSGNTDGAIDHNRRLIDKYKDRISLLDD